MTWCRRIRGCSWWSLCCPRDDRRRGQTELATAIASQPAARRHACRPSRSTAGETGSSTLARRRCKTGLPGCRAAGQDRSRGSLVKLLQPAEIQELEQKLEPALAEATVQLRIWQKGWNTAIWSLRRPRGPGSGSRTAGREVAALAGIPERTHYRRLATLRSGDPSAKGPRPTPAVDAAVAAAGFRADRKSWAALRAKCSATRRPPVSRALRSIDLDDDAAGERCRLDQVQVP
jgi:hypothetical protein